MREASEPLILFERVASGRVKFQGLAVVEKAELVTQFNPAIGYFTNFVFQFAVLSLSTEDEELDWEWIRARRNSELLIKDRDGHYFAYFYGVPLDSCGCVAVNYDNLLVHFILALACAVLLSAMIQIYAFGLR